MSLKNNNGKKVSSLKTETKPKDDKSKTLPEPKPNELVLVSRKTLALALAALSGGRYDIVSPAIEEIKNALDKK